MSEVLELERPARVMAPAPMPAWTPTAPVRDRAPGYITVRDLDFFYGATQALTKVTLEAPSRSLTAIIGASGCGKSTLLRVLNRIYEGYPGQRAVGEVHLDDEDLLDPRLDLRSLRGRIAMVFQRATVFPMSIWDNVAYGARARARLNRAELASTVEASLRQAALWDEVKDRLRTPAAGLSGGQQQRLCIARALGTSPQVLLLDEPTGGLDPISAAAIEALMIDLKQRLTLVLVTHNMRQAARCADHVAFMYLGEMREYGTAHQIFTAPRGRELRDYVGGKFG